MSISNILSIAERWYVYSAADVHPYLADASGHPVGPKAALRHVRLLEGELRNLRRHYEQEIFDCEGSCELDRDGLGGKSSPCRRCPSHPLRDADDPAAAIALYLGKKHDD